MISALLSRIASDDRLWRPLDATVLRIPRKLDALRREVERHRATLPGEVARALHELCQDLTVRSGICEGLQFPAQTGVFAASAPMLLGCYEHELQPTLRHLLVTRDYDLLVDVGCAEGYFAVGLARLAPRLRVIACDIDPQATAYCAKMAALNDVADRVTTHGAVTSAALADLVRDVRRALILSDCEGYERELFADASALERHDCVVECHDAYTHEPITPALEQAFLATHDTQGVTGLTDIDKARQAVQVVPVLERYEWPLRRALISEHRAGAAGYWLVATSRT